MNFYINGELSEIIVDDFFPCEPVNGTPAFSKTNGNEIWVLLLEKAWAKINGNYEKTRHGLSTVAFSFLTGVPNIFHDHDYEIEFWNSIVDADR